MLTNTFKFTLPILPTLLSAWILNLSDRIFIDKYFNMSDVGIYSLGSKISGSVLILFGAFILAYSHIFMRKLKVKIILRIVTFNKQICLVFLFISFSLFFFPK